MSQDSWFKRLKGEGDQPEHERELVRALAEKSAQLSEADARIVGLERAIELLEHDVEKAVASETALVEKEAARAALEAECAQLSARLAGPDAQHVDLERGFGALNRRITDLTAQLTKAQRERDEVTASYAAFKEGAQRQRIELRGELNGQRTTFERKESEIAALTQQLAIAEERTTLAIRQLEALRVEHAQAIETSELRLDEASRREHGLVLERDKAVDALARALRERDQEVRASSEHTSRALTLAHELSGCLWEALTQALGAAAVLPVLRALEQLGERPARVESLAAAADALTSALEERGLALHAEVTDLGEGVLAVRIAPEIGTTESQAVAAWIGIWAVHTVSGMLGRQVTIERFERDGEALVVRAHPRLDARADRRRALMRELESSGRRGR